MFSKFVHRFVAMVLTVLGSAFGFFASSAMAADVPVVAIYHHDVMSSGSSAASLQFGDDDVMAPPSPCDSGVKRIEIKSYGDRSGKLWTVQNCFDKDVTITVKYREYTPNWVYQPCATFSPGQILRLPLAVVSDVSYEWGCK